MSSNELIEAALRDLAHHIDWPGEVNVAKVPATSATASRRRLAWAAAIVGLILAFAALPVGREAIAGLARVVGIRIEFRDTNPNLAAGLALGAPVARAAAVDAVDFEVRVPAALGDPDAFYLRSGPQVWAVWAPSDDLPLIEGSSAGLILAQFRANPEEESIVKLAGAGIEVIAVDIDGRTGFWLEGGPHTVVFNNGAFAEASRSTGNVLIWTLGEITYRLETALSLPKALDLARQTIPLR